MSPELITCRPPTIDDAASMWRLVRDSGVLDANSLYCYLLLCKHFSDTCAIAETPKHTAGFVTGYLPPGRNDTLFIWQIGVTSAFRGQGVAIRLLREVLQRPTCRAVTFLESTVGPSNQASRAMYTALARSLDTRLSEQPCFDARHFSHHDHEPEILFRIGPFSDSRQDHP